MLRLASVYPNAITGDLGERELLNRAQLLLEGIEIKNDGEDNSNNTIKGGIVVEGIQTPKLSRWIVGWTGLTGSAQGGPTPSLHRLASVVVLLGRLVTVTVTNVTVQAALTDTAAALYGRNNTTYHYVSLQLECIEQYSWSWYQQLVRSRVVQPAEVRDEFWYSRIRFRTNNRNNTNITAGQNYTFTGGAVTNASMLNINKASWDVLVLLV